MHSGYTCIVKYVCSLGIEPTTFALPQELVYKFSTDIFSEREREGQRERERERESERHRERGSERERESESERERERE